MHQEYFQIDDAFDCKKYGDGKWPNPNDCGQTFWWCVNGISFKYDCPSDAVRGKLHYKKSIDQCDYKIDCQKEVNDLYNITTTSPPTTKRTTTTTTTTTTIKPPTSQFIMSKLLTTYYINLSIKF